MPSTAAKAIRKLPVLPTASEKSRQVILEEIAAIINKQIFEGSLTAKEIDTFSIKIGEERYCSIYDYYLKNQNDKEKISGQFLLDNIRKIIPSIRIPNQDIFKKIVDTINSQNGEGTVTIKEIENISIENEERCVTIDDYYLQNEASGVEMLKIIAKYGIIVNGPMTNDSSVLCSFVSSENEKMVELLIKNGANPIVDFDEDSPLVLAAQTGNIEIAKILLSGGADPINYSFLSDCPLLCALSNGHYEMANLLIENGCQIDNMPINELVVKKDVAAIVELFKKSKNAEEFKDKLEEGLLSHQPETSVKEFYAEKSVNLEDIEEIEI